MDNPDGESNESPDGGAFPGNSGRAFRGPDSPDSFDFELFGLRIEDTGLSDCAGNEGDRGQIEGAHSMNEGVKNNEDKQTRDNEDRQGRSNKENRALRSEERHDSGDEVNKNSLGARKKTTQGGRHKNIGSKGWGEEVRNNKDGGIVGAKNTRVSPGRSIGAAIGWNWSKEVRSIGVEDNRGRGGEGIKDGNSRSTDGGWAELFRNVESDQNTVIEGMYNRNIADRYRNTADSQDEGIVGVRNRTLGNDRGRSIDGARGWNWSDEIRNIGVESNRSRGEEGIRDRNSQSSARGWAELFRNVEGSQNTNNEGISNRNFEDRRRNIDCGQDDGNVGARNETIGDDRGRNFDGARGWNWSEEVRSSGVEDKSGRSGEGIKGRYSRSSGGGWAELFRNFHDSQNSRIERISNKNIEDRGRNINICQGRVTKGNRTGNSEADVLWSGEGGRGRSTEADEDKCVTSTRVGGAGQSRGLVADRHRSSEGNHGRSNEGEDRGGSLTDCDRGRAEDDRGWRNRGGATAGWTTNDKSKDHDDEDKGQFIEGFPYKAMAQRGRFIDADRGRTYERRDSSERFNDENRGRHYDSDESRGRRAKATEDSNDKRRTYEIGEGRGCIGRSFPESIRRMGSRSRPYEGDENRGQRVQSHGTERTYEGNEYRDRRGRIMDDNQDRAPDDGENKTCEGDEDRGHSDRFFEDDRDRRSRSSADEDTAGRGRGGRLTEEDSDKGGNGKAYERDETSERRRLINSDRRRVYKGNEVGSSIGRTIEDDEGMTTDEDKQRAYEVAEDSDHDCNAGRGRRDRFIEGPRFRGTRSRGMIEQPKASIGYIFMTGVRGRGNTGRGSESDEARGSSRSWDVVDVLSGTRDVYVQSVVGRGNRGSVPEHEEAQVSSRSWHAEDVLSDTRDVYVQSGISRGNSGSVLEDEEARVSSRSWDVEDVLSGTRDVYVQSGIGRENRGSVLQHEEARVSSRSWDVEDVLSGTRDVYVQSGMSRGNRGSVVEHYEAQGSSSSWDVEDVLSGTRDVYVQSGIRRGNRGSVLEYEEAGVSSRSWDVEDVLSGTRDVYVQSGIGRGNRGSVLEQDDVRGSNRSWDDEDVLSGTRDGREESDSVFEHNEARGSRGSFFADSRSRRGSNSSVIVDRNRRRASEARNILIVGCECRCPRCCVITRFGARDSRYRNKIPEDRSSRDPDLIDIDTGDRSPFPPLIFDYLRGRRGSRTIFIGDGTTESETDVSRVIALSCFCRCLDCCVIEPYESRYSRGGTSGYSTRRPPNLMCTIDLDGEIKIVPRVIRDNNDHRTSRGCRTILFSDRNNPDVIRRMYSECILLNGNYRTFVLDISDESSDGNNNDEDSGSSGNSRRSGSESDSGSSSHSERGRGF